jgi:hypothetical protein
MTAVLCHSEQCVTPLELRQAGAAFFGELGAWAFDAFDELNTLCFGGRLQPRPILWGLTPHGRALGFYSPRDGHITLHTSLIRPSGNAWRMRSLLGEQFARDVLVHEMVHASQCELLGHEGFGGNDTHNCESWCSEIMRITPLLGMPPIKAKPIRQKRVNGSVQWYTEPEHLQRKAIASWPHSIRPRGYYEQAVQNMLDHAA